MCIRDSPSAYQPTALPLGQIGSQLVKNELFREGVLLPEWLKHFLPIWHRMSPTAKCFPSAGKTSLDFLLCEFWLFLCMLRRSQVLRHEYLCLASRLFWEGIAPKDTNSFGRKRVKTWWFFETGRCIKTHYELWRIGFIIMRLRWSLCTLYLLLLCLYDVLRALINSLVCWFHRNVASNKEGTHLRWTALIIMWLMSLVL